jgi:hypothetical protein
MSTAMSEAEIQEKAKRMAGGFIGPLALVVGMTSDTFRTAMEELSRTYVALLTAQQKAEVAERELAEALRRERVAVQERASEAKRADEVLERFVHLHNVASACVDPEIVSRDPAHAMLDRTVKGYADVVVKWRGNLHRPLRDMLDRLRVAVWRVLDEYGTDNLPLLVRMLKTHDEAVELLKSYPIDEPTSSTEGEP